MKFGVQISEGCLNDFVNVYRLSFDEEERELFMQFQRLIQTSDLHINSDLSSFGLNHSIWKYLQHLTTGAGDKKRLISSKELYESFLKEPLRSTAHYFFDDSRDYFGIQNRAVFYTVKEEIAEQFANVSCCLNKSRLNSISIRQNSDFSRKSWKLFESYRHPTSTILVYDSYLFAGEINREIKTRITKTVIPLIKSIVRSIEEIEEIWLIGSMKYFAGGLHGEQLSRKTLALKTFLKSEFELNGFNIEPKVTLHSTHLEHDRRLLTDYIQVKPGSSFLFFNEHGEIPKGGFTVHVAPLYQEDIQDDLKDFKRALSKEIKELT